VSGARAILFETFAVRLIRAQRLRGIDNTRLAAMTALDPTSISRYRMGTRLPDWWAALEIGRALNVSIDWLASRTEVMEVAKCPDTAIQ